MASPAERMKAMRERRRRRSMRELRLVVPDASSKLVRRRVARQVAALNRHDELDALKWIEAVSELDSDETRRHRNGRGERGLWQAAACDHCTERCLSRASRVSCGLSDDIRPRGSSRFSRHDRAWR